VHLAPRDSDQSGDGKKPLNATEIDGFGPVIPRDKRINHLDKLNMEGGRNETEASSPPVIRRYDNQYTHHDQ
jgi:hypothetical protein